MGFQQKNIFAKARMFVYFTQVFFHEQTTCLALGLQVRVTIPEFLDPRIFKGFVDPDP